MVRLVKISIMKNNKCKICRREGIKLFLKGERCYLAKCSFLKRKYPPGVHGPKGYPKISEYGKQLREKQKVKRTYGFLERQLKNYVKKAIQTTGNAEENLLKLFEQRLDNVIYRLGFSLSRSGARQIVNHGHIRINGRRVDIPSFQIKVGQKITLKPNSKIIKKIKENLAFNKDKAKIPEWLSLDENNLSAQILALPRVDDLLKEINCKLIIEFYSR